MNQIEQRLEALETSRIRFRWLCVLSVVLMPLVGLLAGAGIQGAIGTNSEAVPSRVVTRSLVVVDDQNRPRLDLGYDDVIGPHLFLRDSAGMPMLALTAPRASGVITILDSNGHSVAMLSRSGSGDGQLKLSDSQGRTIARMGQWAGLSQPAMKLYPIEVE